MMNGSIGLMVLLLASSVWSVSSQQKIRGAVGLQNIYDNDFNRYNSSSNDDEATVAAIPHYYSQPSLCKSIIAIGSTILPSDVNNVTNNTNNADDGNDLASVQFNTDEQFICELHDGSDVPLVGTVEQMQQLRELLNNGTLVSGLDTVDVVQQEDEQQFQQESKEELASIQTEQETSMTRVRARTHSRTFDNNYIHDSPPPPVPTTIQLPPGPIHLQTKSITHNPNTRKLATYHGIKTVLAVKVIDKHKLQHPDTPKVISDKIFGTHGDVYTMSSQFGACSFDKLQIFPAGLNDERLMRKLSEVGVLEVEIDVALVDSSQGVIRNEVRKAVERELGFGLPGKVSGREIGLVLLLMMCIIYEDRITSLFQKMVIHLFTMANLDHVMVILEGCYIECGWSAYAFVNSWFSVYKGDNYKYVAVQLHEIGHNLNMAHSGGLNNKIYTDHTCLMGNPLFSDDVGRMCYNAAKNYQLAKAGAWYNDKPEHAISWDSGRKGGTSWSGQIIGVADYDNNPNDHPIVVRIVAGSDRDLYLGFNRQTRMNSDVKQAGDQVTLYEAGNGDGYAQSFLKRAMGEGDTHTIDNWRKSKQPLRITVNKIGITSSPGYADVTITFGTQPSQPPPSFRPTSSPSHGPTLSPTTSPTMTPSKSPSKSPTFSPSFSPSTTPSSVNSRQLPTAAPMANNTATEESSPTARPSINILNATMPTSVPTKETTLSPTHSPIHSPTPDPTRNPAPINPEIIEYSIENRSAKGSAKGLTFTIRARRNIVITGFDIPPRKNRSCQMRVYTQPGDYRYIENAIAKHAITDHIAETSGGWSLMFDDDMKLNTNRLADIRVEDGQEVYIPKDEVQSFIIYCNRGMLVAPGRQRDEGKTFSQNDDIEVREGIKSKKAFSKYTGYAQLMGKVRYYVK